MAEGHLTFGDRTVIAEIDRAVLALREVTHELGDELHAVARGEARAQRALTRRLRSGEDDADHAIAVCVASVRRQATSPITASTK